MNFFLGRPSFFQMLRITTVFLFSAAGAYGQSADAPPAFDVASVKASQLARGGGEGSRRENIQVSPGSVIMHNVSLKSSIRWAYHVMDYQVTGPDWIGFERYDISAKAAGPAAEDQLRPMMQTLLAERFKLTFHRQTKEMQAYVLTVGKGGLKVHESQTEGESVIEPQKERMRVVIQRTPVSKLVETLQNVLRAPVIDMTELKGKYDLTIDASKYILDRQPGDAPPDPVSIIMTGLQVEMGLKLESKKAPLDLLIVDHAEKTPIEN